ncbi:zinc finger protein CONSTANS-LIKE 1-like isoform X1 [Cucurbita moschata]|uniref:Zinc finger protein CONSTANS-LIKE 1-like isoform X1 n=2 Tax=Cucurbita moschata TaxID=3662 RepID=A0A6J1FX75_CUCMO|nr:zinc finger protein CONSTANS-LIKE 1-like isoform X1 [Cucurbita moschata]
MASFPHFYSDHLYPNNFSDLQSLLMAAGDPGIGGIRNDDDNNNNINLPHGEETFVSTLDQMASFESDTQSPLLTMPYPDLTVPSSPEFNKGMYGIHSVIGNQPRVPGSCNYDDELLGFVPDLKPFYRNIWGTQSSYELHGVEETNIKVASRYSEEERKERIVRYLKKRNQRNFNKTIKYACRKTLADRRTRVRGRFARNNNELCDTEIHLKTNHLTAPSHNQTNKEEEEESWLQELAASLMYLPYVTNYGV